MNEKLISEYAYRVRKSNDLMEVKSLLKQFGEEFCKAAVISSCDCKDNECCYYCEFEKTGTRNLTMPSD
ncbi:MAG: hypothetical protein RIR01_1365 [Bacteroidota bacterium]|jgi:endonuclease III